MSLDIGELPGGFSLTLASDFSLDQNEIEKGQAAAAGFLESLKGEERNTAREALETLTLVFSTGACEGVDFPWHQLRAHHGQAALHMLKESGAPTKLESLRCQLDPHHKFRQDSDKFPNKKLQRFRTALKSVLKESRDLGYLSDEDWARVNSPNKAVQPRPGDRIVSHGEFRALLLTCQQDDNTESLRDRLVFYFLYHGGLMLAELLSVSIDDLHFDQKTQQVTVKTGKAKNQKSRRVSLPNEALITLEDWLEVRGNDRGALLTPVKRGSVEIKRLTGGEVKAICEKRAAEVGVELFTPDELRKSPAATLSIAKAEARKAKRAEAAEQALFDEESAGLRKMAKVCFPVWELGIKS